MLVGHLHCPLYEFKYLTTFLPLEWQVTGLFAEFHFTCSFFSCTSFLSIILILLIFELPFPSG